METENYLAQGEQDRQDMIGNLETQGISGLTGTETITQLVPQILNIQAGGGGIVSETFNSSNASYSNPFIFAGKKKGIYWNNDGSFSVYFYYKINSTDTTVRDAGWQGLFMFSLNDDFDNFQYNNIIGTAIFVDGVNLKICKIKHNGNSITFADYYTNLQTLSTGNQSISGTKTFSSIPKVSSYSAPTTDTQLTAKKYVDDKPTTYSGYDSTKTQVLKNVNGTLTWVDE